MIPVFDGDKIIAEVEYNQNLDFWDGSNWTCGSVGRHLGLTQLEDGRYVLIHGSQWQGERNYGEIITPEQAVQEIFKSGNNKLFEEFTELDNLRKQNMLREKR